MYHPPSKRKQLIQRIVTYSFMTVATLGLVTMLVFIMLGYQFDNGDGKIEQGGLMQFDTQPNGADVTIDGVSFGTRTPSKSTVSSGQHYVTMSRSGYDTWRKSVTVGPGSVLWLSYVRLIPNKLTPANVTELSSVSSTAVSTDTKWMAIKEDPATPVVRLADLSRDNVKVTNLTLPEDMYTHPSEGKNQSFTLDKWDAGSRYILVKHVYDGDKIEWLVLDTQDASKTVNVTKLLDINASKLIFSGSNSKVMYAQTGTDVRKLDLGAATLSRPLISNVAEFTTYDRSMLTYVTLRDAATGKRSVGYYEDGADAPHEIRSFTDDGALSLHVALGKYFGDMYEAVAYGDAVTLYKGDLPKEKNDKPLTQVAKMTLPGGTQYLSIKTNGRFVVAQNGATYKVYDLELKKETTTTLKGTTPVTNEIKWIDDYMPWSDRDGTLRLYEFDGMNQHDIMPVTSDLSATLSPNGKYLYGISKAANGTFHLERVQMILP